MRIIAYDILSIGNNNSVIYCPDEILKRSILLNSKRFILIHNHPKGDPSPSREDKDIIRKFEDYSKIELKPLDFIIVGDMEMNKKKKKYWSMFEEMEGGDYSLGSVV